MEVALDAQHYCFALGNAFLHVCPLPRELYGSLDCFCTSVHRKNHVVFKHLGDLLGEAAKDAVIERSRAKSQFLGLLEDSRDASGLAMALIVDISIYQNGNRVEKRPTWFTALIKI